MPQYVQVGNDVVEFPDNMSDADIAAALRGPTTAAQPTAQPQGRSIGQEILRQLGLTARAGYEAFTAPATAVLEAGRGAYNIAAEALGSEKKIGRANV